MIYHPVQSLYSGTFPMGLATLSEMVVFLLVPAYPGPRCARLTFAEDGADSWGRFVYLAWSLWWIVAVLSIVVDIVLPYLM